MAAAAALLAGTVTAQELVTNCTLTGGFPSRPYGAGYAQVRLRTETGFGKGKRTPLNNNISTFLNTGLCLLLVSRIDSGEDSLHPPSRAMFAKGGNAQPENSTRAPVSATQSQQRWLRRRTSLEGEDKRPHKHALRRGLVRELVDHMLRWHGE